MMREIETPTPDGARWFQGDALDLSVWENDTDVADSLQLTVSRGAEEQAFLWSAAEGIRAATVDAGTRPGRYPAAPTFHDSRDVDLRALLEALDEQSVYIDPRVRILVLDLLRKAGDATPEELGDLNMAMAEEHIHVPPQQTVFSPGLAASATLHCLTGCVIGESIGLLIGVALGWPPVAIALFATALAFISGFSLTLIPLTLRQGMAVGAAFKLVWLGETVSIGTMEIAMNAADYLVGGMTAGSIFTAQFWIAMAVAVVAGYAAGYPVNYFMLKRGIKEKCH